MQRDTHSAVADAFAQHPSAMKMVVAAFTGHCGLGGFTTRLIKNYIVDGSLSVGVNRFALPGYLSWGLVSLSGGDDRVCSHQVCRSHLIGGDQLIHWGQSCPPGRPKHADKYLTKFIKGKCKALYLWRKNLETQCRLGTGCLRHSPAEKDLGVWGTMGWAWESSVHWQQRRPKVAWIVLTRA